MSLEGSDSLLEVKVKDEGVGLKPEDMEKLFKPFAMFGKMRSKKSISSHGFGLSVCK